MFLNFLPELFSCNEVFMTKSEFSVGSGGSKITLPFWTYWIKNTCYTILATNIAAYQTDDRLS